MDVDITKPSDFSEIAVQWRQKHISDLINPDYTTMVMNASISVTLRNDEGSVIAIVGVCPSDNHRAELWSVISRHAGPHLLAITRFLRKRLNHLDYVRLEAFADPTFKPAARWLKMLGFAYEGRREQYTEFGDMDCWVRIKHG